MEASVASVVAASALSFLAACSTPGTMLRYAPPDPNIVGIADALESHPVVDVVLVHGMCFHDQQWVTETNDALALALDMAVIHTDDPTAIGASGGLLYKAQISGPSGTVRTFAILWSPAAKPAREKLCYDTGEATQPPDDTCPAGPNHLGDKRALLNAQLKDGIMDGCLSEAMYAMGDVGRVSIGSTVEEGLEIALNGGAPVPDTKSLSTLAAQAPIPLFVVTQSLGSKLFIDAAINMAGRSCPAFHSMAASVGRTYQVFMEANQLPILALAYNPGLDDKCAGPKALSAQPKGLGALVTLHRSGRLAKSLEEKPLKVAAFSDPNDVLSYTLVPAPDLPAGLEPTDIVVVNDWAWLGLFENPMSAHTTYGGKCRVQQVIAHGTKGLTMPCVGQ